MTMTSVCAGAGISALADGRVMVTGGNSDYKTSIFDPVANDWTIGPPMNIPRGYQVRSTHPCPNPTVPRVRPAAMRPRPTPDT